MEREIRNLLERTTQQARSLLETEYAKQLEGSYDILLNGTIHANPGKHLTAEERFFRCRLVAAIEHRRAQGETNQDSVGNFLRECAFTFLNRIVALRMLEARSIIKQSVSKAENSAGFTNEYLLLAPGLKSLPDKGYRLFLESLFDEIGREVGILFDPNDLAGQLWPDRPKLLELLNLLNNPDLDGAWRADETIGWVYQYFNTDEERRKMRAESGAPRNSREMAVRNQFFTPRYVVEFLADNTLGRTWFEMCQGQTSLKLLCRYMVQRPSEHFLQRGESAPVTESHGDRTQEELLSEPVYVPYRAPKDPRELRVLDPACGSGHFLLYCFDLLERIYEEAWEAHVGSLRQDYSDRSSLLLSLPELILRHNLYGIDIDPRAAQIGSLALWLRAQRAWQWIPRAERPGIRKTNVVIAEPMPGEADLLNEFCEGLEPRVLGRVIRDVFERMRIAGDAGALLHIETDIAEILEEAKSQWLSEEVPTDRQGNPLLFAKSTQRTIFEVERVTSDFWTYAEERVFEALSHFAATAATDGGFRRRLFADDAERGFAFIDICRRRFDVMLMNPPFGDASLPSKHYIDDFYGDTKGDVYKAFVEGAFDRLVPAGMLGIISSRNGFFLNQSQDWRERVVLRFFCPLALADLGDGVLDAAVSTAAYVLRRLDQVEKAGLTLGLLPDLRDLAVDRLGAFSVPKYQRQRGDLKRHQALQEISWLKDGGFVRELPGGFARYERLSAAFDVAPHTANRSDPLLHCFGLLMAVDKGLLLRNSVDALQNGTPHPQLYLVRPSSFQLVPTTPFAYWVTDRVRRLFVQLPRLESDRATVKVGTQTSDDWRFTRAWWEVPPEAIAARDFADCSAEDWSKEMDSKRWFWFSKGGGVGAFSGDLHLVILWAKDAREIKAYVSMLINGGHWSKNIRNPLFYFKGGLAFGNRSRRFGVSPFPRSAIFSISTPVIHVKDKDILALVPAYLTSNITRSLLGLMATPRKMEIGYVGNIPLPQTADLLQMPGLLEASSRYTEYCIDIASRDETQARFQFSGLTPRPDIDSATVLFENGGHVDQTVSKALHLSTDDELDLIRSLAWVTGLKADTAEAVDDEGEVPAEPATSMTERLISLAVGCVCGRWDIRKWRTPQHRAVCDDPFQPLPACPPASLLGRDGLPARSETFDDDNYPLSIAWSGILVDEEHHKWDICAAVLDCLAVVLDTYSADVPELLGFESGVSDLREYFRSSKFFQFHLNQYFKSRRRAPIYWQMSVPSKRYSVWLYYHRLSRDTLWRVLGDFVKPRFAQEERRLVNLRADAGSSPTSAQRRTIQEQESLVSELATFCRDLELVAPIWNPNLNDGVLLNFALLWRQSPQIATWQRELKEAWQKLGSEVYDWSHIAMHLWPERVIPKCRIDRSLAIAHGLEDLFWELPPEGKWRPKTVSAAELKAAIEGRTSKPVKAALQRLLSQSTGTSQTRREHGAVRG